MAIVAPDQTNVSGSKPGILGAVFRGKLGTVVDSDPSTPLSEELESFGYVGESGVSFAPNREEGSDKVAYGGDVMDTTGGSYAPSATFTILEYTRDTVLRSLYHSEDVTIDASGKIRIKDSGRAPEPCVLVFEFRTGLNTVERKVVDYAVFKTNGDRVLDNESLGEVELTYAFRAQNGIYSTTDIATVVSAVEAEAASFGLPNATATAEPTEK